MNLKPGDVVHILPGTILLARSRTDSEFTHIAINPNTLNGIVEWLKPVSNEKYMTL